MWFDRWRFAGLFFSLVFASCGLFLLDINSRWCHSEAPEINISLAQYLEEKHGRVLPPFDDDEQVAFTIEAYFESVRKAVSGLKRWNVRRFLTLGHFAFGRLCDVSKILRPHFGQHILYRTSWSEASLGE